MLRLTEIVALHAIGFYFLFNGRVAAGLGEQMQTNQLLQQTSRSSLFTASYDYFNQVSDSAITFLCITAFLGLVSGRCGWLMHEGGHYSLTGSIMYDAFTNLVNC